MKFTFDTYICIAAAGGTGRSGSAENREIRHVEIEFEIPRQAVVQFVVGGVLADVWILKLENIVFVEEFEVKLTTTGDGWIIRVERHLSQERRSRAKRNNRE